jgi:hypothetical protein
MKIFSFLQFFFLSSWSEKIIQNVKLPACSHCIHHQSNPLYNDFANPMNFCTKFGEKNIITNKIMYDTIISCRKDETKCGLLAKHFEEEPELSWKITKYNIQYHFSTIFFVFNLSILLFLIHYYS